MRFISWFVMILIVLSIMYLLTQNAVFDAVPELKIFHLSYFNVNLAYILFGAFTFGMLVGYLVPVFQYLGAKGEVRRIKRENRKLLSELNDLRNLSIDTEIEAQEKEPLPAAEITPQSDEKAEDSTEEKTAEE